MKKITTFIITAILLSFLGLNILFKPTQLANISSSTVMGLAIMRAMAVETMSYQEAIANKKPTLIEFYADWCTTCQSMSPILKDLKASHAQEVNFVMINIDYPENNQLIRKYQVTGVPQWNILDSQGKVKETLAGKIPKSVLESILFSKNLFKNKFDIS